MVKLLGLLDIAAAVLLVSTALNAEIPIWALIAIPIFLFLKAWISIFDIGGITDMGIVIIIVLSIFLTVPSWILFSGAVLIGFKGVMSLFA